MMELYLVSVMVPRRRPGTKPTPLVINAVALKLQGKLTQNPKVEPIETGGIVGG